MKLHGFLSRLSKASQGQISRYVIGNPSVDYDSFFGSIILAYILSNTTGNLHQPIIDCSRQDLKLRFEITGILQKVNINTDGLYFRQTSEEIYPQGDFSLYDHNERADLQKIQYIVDHHAYIEEKLKTNKFIIDKMGSGLTILYYLLTPRRLKQIQTQQSSFLEKYQKFIQTTSFLKNGQSQLIDTDINEIIRNGVIIDTFNFDAKMKERWTIFDKKVVEFIEKQQKFDYGHKQIEQLKFDEKKNKELTLHQSLVKDRKTYTYGHMNATYSIIYLEPKTFFENYKQQKFDVDEQKTDIYFLMFLYRYTKQQFRREIMYRIKNKQEQERVDLAFSKVATLFNLKVGERFNQWNRYIDPSLTISRKKFEPQFQKTLKEAMINSKM